MRQRFPLSLFAAGVVLAGCQNAPVNTASTSAAGDAAQFVRPIAGLSETQLAQFNRGKALFEKVFSPADGLGPLYNSTSCRSCHGLPNTGGGSTIAATLVAADKNGAQVTLKEQGAPIIQVNSLGGVPLETIPLEATVVSFRITPPTFGAGLLEAIAPAAITDQLAPNAERQSWGVRGKANWEFNQIGRFGWKAQKGDLIDFTQQACQFEMGLSSPGRPQEHFPNLIPQKLSGPANYDDAAHPWVKAFFDAKAARGIPREQPDLTQQQVEDMAAFQRFQAPPERLTLSVEAQAGEKLFLKNGCAVCHVPEMHTGTNAIGVKEGLAVPLYSDLLLHDMGDTLSDNFLQGVASGKDWRTPPLWGLRFRERFLHDGRTNSLQEAIMLHGGEAAKSTRAYAALNEPDQKALQAFLRSL